MHDILQEVSYVMLFTFRSEEAQSIWAGLGQYDRSLQPEMTGRQWVLRLSLLERWAAVSKVFGQGMELRQIRAETKRFYTMHQGGVLDTRCLAQLEWTRRLEVRCSPLHSTLVKRWNTFQTLLINAQLKEGS